MHLLKTPNEVYTNVTNNDDFKPMIFISAFVSERYLRGSNSIIANLKRHKTSGSIPWLYNMTGYDTLSDAQWWCYSRYRMDSPVFKTKCVHGVIALKSGCH